MPQLVQCEIWCGLSTRLIRRQPVSATSGDDAASRQIFVWTCVVWGISELRDILDF